VNGLVQGEATLRPGSADGFGFNVGSGVTYRVGASHLKVFAEARYHHAYPSQIDTQVVPVTFGIRW